MEDVKVCRDCNKSLPVELFVKNKNWCKSCSCKYQKERRLKASGGVRIRKTTRDKDDDQVLNDFNKIEFPSKTPPTVTIEYEDLSNAIDVLRIFTVKERKEMSIKIDGNILKIY